MVSASLGGLEVLVFECVFRWEIGHFPPLSLLLAQPPRTLFCGPPSAFRGGWASKTTLRRRGGEIGTDSFLPLPSSQCCLRPSFSLFLITPDWLLLRKIGGCLTRFFRPGKKPANTGVFLTNEKTQVSESESHLWKKWTANLAGGTRGRRFAVHIL